ATYQGLFSWDRRGDSVINWGKRIAELNGVIALNIREDAEGFIWISSAKGPASIDPLKNEIVFFDNSKRKGKKLPDDGVGALYIDKAQHIWVSGTSYLAELDKNGEVLNFYNDRNGFLATSVYNILEDPQHFIWIATDNKLHRLDPSTG